MRSRHFIVGSVCGIFLGASAVSLMALQADGSGIRLLPDTDKIIVTTADRTMVLAKHAVSANDKPLYVVASE